MIFLSLCLLIVLVTSPAVTALASPKRVLVTGASGGIGKALALRLKDDYQVFVHYHERTYGAQETARLLGDSCAGTAQADFRQPAQIHALLRTVNEIWPDGWDILINNAGIVSKVPLEEDTDNIDSWHECLAVNLHAPRLLCQLALPVFRHRRGGVILNVSSIHGERSNEYMGAYAASKAALDSLTRTMAIEYAKFGVRVNAIAPGVVPVERTWDAFYEQDSTCVTPTGRAWEEKIPVGRLGTVEQVAEASMGLLTNEWVSGSVWTVDGGMMARNNMPPRDCPDGATR